MKKFPTENGWSAWDTYFAEAINGRAANFVGGTSAPQLLEQAVESAAMMADFALKERAKRIVAEPVESVEGE